MMMEFLREGKRRSVAQQAVETVVKRVGYFNGAEDQNFLKVYNGEMDSRGVDKAMRLQFFCWVVCSTDLQRCKRASRSS